MIIVRTAARSGALRFDLDTLARALLRAADAEGELPSGYGIAVLVYDGPDLAYAANCSRERDLGVALRELGDLLVAGADAAGVE